MVNRTGRAKVSMTSPRAFAVCDRCGMVYNHRDLGWQQQWIGPALKTLNKLVCDSCRDKPQEQLRTFIIPPDPIPIDTPRPPQYDNQVVSYLGTEGDTSALGDISDQARLITEDGDFIILEIEDVPTPDPANPAIYP